MATHVQHDDLQRPSRSAADRSAADRSTDDLVDNGVDLAADAFVDEDDDDADPDKIPDDICFDDDGNFYYRGMDDAERADFIASINRGIADAEAGRGIPLEEFLAQRADRWR